ncbi:dUTP diphosphatase [Chengkuizengella marina]|uniref:dUTP diphosphatase n=1 Tax=Chengkuizengella marina TaxID=2507566 RepID=A0A6N9Q8C5_9BACL|nr:deoxyuridine 5'-triphosphate nucleotidohydrolase [Chengkuizengella marina]NBI31000.1 deoxyuridine 5'-triphosphate nucleotidohydrolase [Chengkuizengella marina]
MQVKIKKLNQAVNIPKYKTKGAAGFDLPSAEEVIIAPGESVGISTGLAFEIPEGYELQVRPRSGVSFKTKLRFSNTVGTVDYDYRGEVKIAFDNFYRSTSNMVNKLNLLDGTSIETNELYEEGTYLISLNDRIAQGVIKVVQQAEFVEVEELSDTERGTGGFGSTGV